jgi:ribosomal protein S27E
MAVACVEPLTLYRPRDPQASDLWRLLDQHFETFRQVYDERFAPKYGFWRPIVEHSVQAFLKCGDLHEGFARVRCPDCHHEMFVAFSCKQRCTCPSCHQKRALLTAIHVAEDVCAPVAHRQVVLTIPKRLPTRSTGCPAHPLRSQAAGPALRVRLDGPGVPGTPQAEVRRRPGVPGAPRPG